MQVKSEKFGVIDIETRRHARAARMLLRVDNLSRRVSITLPTWETLKAAERFANSQISWIETRLQKMPEAGRFSPGEEILYRGEKHLLVHHAGRGQAPVWVDNGQIIVSGDLAFFERRLNDWLRRQAKNHFTSRVITFAAKIGRPIKSITIRDTKSRWGSCTYDGGMNFSWRLILAPDFVSSYVAAHEVAHLIERNHSPAFWSWVTKIYGPHEQARAWLKAYGAELHRYG